MSTAKSCGEAAQSTDGHGGFLGALLTDLLQHLLELGLIHLGYERLWSFVMAVPFLEAVLTAPS